MHLWILLHWQKRYWVYINRFRLTISIVELTLGRGGEEVCISPLTSIYLRGDLYVRAYSYSWSHASFFWFLRQSQSWDRLYETVPSQKPYQERLFFSENCRFFVYINSNFEDRFLTIDWSKIQSVTYHFVANFLHFQKHCRSPHFKG